MRLFIQGKEITEEFLAELYPLVKRWPLLILSANALFAFIKHHARKTTGIMMMLWSKGTLFTFAVLPAVRQNCAGRQNTVPA